jgi:nucleotide-binding universal stress UspA family protein
LHGGGRRFDPGILHLADRTFSGARTRATLGTAVMFARILVATDGTEAALRAVKVAVGLVSAFAAESILVTVVDVPELVALRLNVDRGGLEDHVERTAQKALESSLRVLRDARVGAEVKVLVGSAAEAIVAEAHQSGADLVVMGRGSRDEPRAFLLGTVSDRVSRQLKVPLLLVP